MQEDALKLVLLALEDGSALSRKVLVLFVVQKLEARFPQASKTSIGHVVQLLYRASCFKVRDAACVRACSAANMCGNGDHVIINGIIQTRRRPPTSNGTKEPQFASVPRNQTVINEAIT